MTTRYTTFSGTTGSVLPGASTTVDITGMPSSNLDIKMVTITPSVLSAGELCKVELFKRDTYVAADRCYVAENFYGVFVDPAYDNGTGPVSLNEGDVASYEDLDDTLELHVKFTNNGPTAKTFTYSFKVEAAYYQAALTAGTPAVTSSGGALTSVAAASNYLRMGSLIWFECAVTVTTDGGSGALRVTLPIAPVTGSVATGSGQRTDNGTEMLVTIDGSVTYATVVKYDGSYPTANGVVIRFSILYRAAP